ncbi:Hypothetical protein SRAE_2000135000 [Strongyloides ratti]|uniref:Tox-URI2 domain-containing protein n=1 Tax=Strongyloides ratti TaxID=34506 RepID=A0A090LEY1_STRRB|nr:Hypothetical protein SRAE_2000135000 [Strongyloides ratti]CEF66683.1 Hypothetical protein SRAE_2000135000 [Strongyloides ratti]
MNDTKISVNTNDNIDHNNKKIIKTNEIILNSVEGTSSTTTIVSGDSNVSSYGYNILTENKRELEKLSGESKNNNEETTLSPKQQRQLRRLSKAFGLKTSRISIVSPDGIRRMVHPKYINYENMKRII